MSKKLIVENTYADGALGTIFGPVKANLAKFGEIVKDSAKLIGGDVAFLVKLTFGRLKKLKDIKEMETKNNQRRKKLLTNIAKNSDELMSSWPDGKVTSMMIAPGHFFTNEALSGVRHVTSDAFKEEMSAFGLDAVPFIGDWLSTEPGTQSEFYTKISQCEPGDAKCFDQAFTTLQGNPEGGKEQGTLSKIATTINSIFLISHRDMGGNLLYEADEDPRSQVSDELLDEIDKRVRDMIDKHFLELRKSWMKEQDGYFGKITSEAADVISANSSLAAAEDANSFFEAIENMKKLSGDQMQDLDVGKMKEGFKEMGAKFKADKNSMEKLEKEFDKEKIEKTEENIEKKLEDIILSSFKAQFLQEMKGTLEDYYEEVSSRLAGGMTDQQQELVSKDPFGAEYMKMIKGHETKLKESLSKLK